MESVHCYRELAWAPKSILKSNTNQNFINYIPLINHILIRQSKLCCESYIVRNMANADEIVDTVLFF